MDRIIEIIKDYSVLILIVSFIVVVTVIGVYSKNSKTSEEMITTTTFPTGTVNLCRAKMEQIPACNDSLLYYHSLTRVVYYFDHEHNGFVPLYSASGHLYCYSSDTGIIEEIVY